MKHKPDSGDWAFYITIAVIVLFLVLMVLEIYEVTDVFTDVPSIEQPACIGDQIIVGRDK